MRLRGKPCTMLLGDCESVDEVHRRTGQTADYINDAEGLAL